MTSIWVQWSAHSHVLQQAVCVRMHNSDTSKECYDQQSLGQCRYNVITCVHRH